MNKNILNVQVFSTISFQDKLLFTKHLSLMIRSGIPIAEAVHDLARQTKSAAFKKVLMGVEAKINNGESFNKALSKYPKVFSPIYINLISIGEQSGTLEKNLEYLAIQLKKDYDFQKKIQAASLYPGIILSTALIVGMGVSIFILPKLVDLFSTLDVDLPITTKILLFFAQTMKSYGILIGIGIILFIMLSRFVTSLPLIKPHWQKLLLSLPFFGKFLQDMQVAALCRNLGIMLQSGLPITTALTSVKESTTNLVYKKYLASIFSSVEKGDQIGSQFEKHPFPYIPSLVARMIEVGEKTGKLDETLIYLGDFYEEEVDNSAENFSTVLEPVLLIMIGLFVAFIALAIISPIYQLTGSIQG